MPQIDRTNRAFDSRIQVAEKAITIADLTAAALSQAIDFDAALPSDAFVFGSQVEITTALSGGGAAAATVDVGISGGDTDGFIDGANVFTGASTPISHPRGVQIPSQAASATPVATVTSDVNVNTLTAGSIKVKVFYFRTGSIS